MEQAHSLRVEASLNNLASIRQFVQERAETLHIDAAAASDTMLAVDEAVTNITVHGYRFQKGMIEIEMHLQDNALMIVLRDQAPPFDPTTVPPPDLTLPLEKRPFGKMGVYLMKQLMDEVTYQRTGDGSNQLTLVKRGLTPG